MKKLLLISLIFLSGCAFDDMMTSVNSTLKSANQTLSGTNSETSTLSRLNDKGTAVNTTVDCEKDVKKSEDWYKFGRKKIYSSNPSQHLSIYNEKEKEIINMQGKLAHYCGYVNRDLDNPNKDYIEKIRLEEAQKKINGGKK
jgi:hypothetical protein